MTGSIEISDYVEVQQDNPYDSTVAALINANDNAREQAVARGEDADSVKPKQVAIKVPAKDEKKTRFKFSKAANNVGRTARLRSVTAYDANGNEISEEERFTPAVDGEGNPVLNSKGKPTNTDTAENVTLVFTLTNKHKARRHQGDTVKSDAANEEVVTEIGSKRPASSKSA